MAVQFSLSYDANGDPILVENTDTGTRKVITSSPVVSEYKSRFDMGNESITDPKEDQPKDESPIYNYINEMEKGADNDLNLSFIEKQNLERYTPEAIQAKETPLAKMQSLINKGLKYALPAKLQLGISILKMIENVLPEERPEIKAIKQFYADPETAKLVESIPGMSNYNLVYGGFPGIKEASYGLANAAAKRQAVIDKTLANKYGLTPEEIAQTKLGTYKGPVSSDLIDRNKKLQDLQDKEKEEITTNPAYGNVPNPVVNLTQEQKDYFSGTNVSGSANQGNDNQGNNNQGNNNQGNNNQGGKADYSSAAETGAKAGFKYGL